jgi:hypothetical protein
MTQKEMLEVVLRAEGVVVGRGQIENGVIFISVEPRTQ